MHSLHIRPAEERDSVALTRCIDAAYAHYKNQIEDLPAVSEGVADDIKAHNVWVAELDKVVIGGLILILRGDFALLANVAVDPKFLGQGVGRGLIERAEAECRALAVSEIRLSTHVKMPENAHLYSRLGWVETGRSGNKVHMSKRV